MTQTLTSSGNLVVISRDQNDIDAIIKNLISRFGSSAGSPQAIMHTSPNSALRIAELQWSISLTEAVFEEMALYVRMRYSLGFWASQWLLPFNAPLTPNVGNVISYSLSSQQGYGLIVASDKGRFLVSQQGDIEAYFDRSQLIVIGNTAFAASAKASWLGL